MRYILAHNRANGKFYRTGNSWYVWRTQADTYTWPQILELLANVGTLHNDESLEIIAVEEVKPIDKSVE